MTRPADMTNPEKLYHDIVLATGELVTGAHEKIEALSAENSEILQKASKLDDDGTAMLAMLAGLGAERLRLTRNLHAAAETIILRAATILTAANGDGVSRRGGIDNAAEDISKAYRELQTLEGVIQKITGCTK